MYLPHKCNAHRRCEGLDRGLELPNATINSLTRKDKEARLCILTSTPRDCDYRQTFPLVLGPQSWRHVTAKVPCRRRCFPKVSASGRQGCQGRAFRGRLCTKCGTLCGGACHTAAPGGASRSHQYPGSMA